MQESMEGGALGVADQISLYFKLTYMISDMAGCLMCSVDGADRAGNCIYETRNS